jgi:hypothetical protein
MDVGETAALVNALDEEIPHKAATGTAIFFGPPS